MSFRQIDLRSIEEIALRRETNLSKLPEWNEGWEGVSGLEWLSNTRWPVWAGTVLNWKYMVDRNEMGRSKIHLNKNFF